MHTSFNQETGVKTWHIKKWYEKAYYIIGIVTTFIWLLAFIAGFVTGLLSD
jgi:hypothetical protein